MIKRETFFNLGMFDENINLYEDWELWIRIIKSGGKVKKIEDVLYFYQKHENQNSLIEQGESIENFDKSDSVYLYVYNKHYDFYKKNGLSLKYFLQHDNDNKYYKRKYYNNFLENCFIKF